MSLFFQAEVVCTGSSSTQRLVHVAEVLPATNVLCQRPQAHVFSTMIIMNEGSYHQGSTSYMVETSHIICSSNRKLWTHHIVGLSILKDWLCNRLATLALRRHYATQPSSTNTAAQEHIDRRLPMKSMRLRQYVTNGHP